MYNYYTENLADFGLREINELSDILIAWLEHGLPDNFEYSGVKPALNRNSGHVFLVNYEHQVAMLNDKKLEIFHSLPYCGDEGFLSDLVAENDPDGLNVEDIRYIIENAQLSNFELSGDWLLVTLDF